MTALTKPPSQGAANPCLDSISRHLEATRFAKKVSGILSLRKALKLSAAKFADLLAYYAGRTYDRRTICNWERAERQPHKAGTPLALPPNYWRKLYAPRKVIAAMHALIADLVTWMSKGRYRARVSGKRTWQVRLVAVRAVKL
jgi:DNA-binding transcriptional regulator YiaG